MAVSPNASWGSSSHAIADLTRGVVMQSSFGAVFLFRLSEHVGRFGRSKPAPGEAVCLPRRHCSERGLLCSRQRAGGLAALAARTLRTPLALEAELAVYFLDPAARGAHAQPDVPKCLWLMPTVTAPPVQQTMLVSVDDSHSSPWLILSGLCSFISRCSSS